jgi:RNA polymerase sigma factor (sigma-70 family)
MGEFAADLPRPRVPALGLRSLGDDRLGRLAASGDARAFEVVYQRHHQALYRYCRSLLGNSEDAADALQSTMAAALRALRGETREIKLKPWLFRIAHNECVSMLRTRRPQTVIDDSLELAAPEGADLATRERLRQLVSDLRELPETQRGALVMRELSGLSYDEIAAVLQSSVPAARQAVFEARCALHDLAEGRAMECENVRRALSDRDGRVLRGRKLRAHLRSCGSCNDFGELIGSRRRDLAAIAPPIPAALAAGVLHHIIGGGAASTGGGGAGLGGSLAAGKAALASGAMKTAAVIAATAAVGAGTAETVHQVSRHHRAHHSVPVRPAPAAKAAAAMSQRTTSAPPNPIPAPVANTPTPKGAGTKKEHAAGRSHHGAVTDHPAPQANTTHPRKHQGGSPGAGQRSDSAPPKPSHPDHPSHPQHPATPAPHGHGPPVTHGKPLTTPVVPTLPPQSNGKAGGDHGQSDLPHGKAPLH